MGNLEGRSGTFWPAGTLNWRAHPALFGLKIGSNLVICPEEMAVGGREAPAGRPGRSETPPEGRSGAKKSCWNAASGRKLGPEGAQPGDLSGTFRPKFRDFVRHFLAFWRTLRSRLHAYCQGSFHRMAETLNLPRYRYLSASKDACSRP